MFVPVGIEQETAVLSVAVTVRDVSVFAVRARYRVTWTSPPVAPNPV